MKIRHVLGPLPLILLANTAFGQDEAIRQPLSLNWGAPVEKSPRLTLLDEKWFPPFDDKLILPGKDAGERGAETAMAQAPVVGAEDWKSRPYLPRGPRRRHPGRVDRSAHIPDQHRGRARDRRGEADRKAHRAPPVDTASVAAAGSTSGRPCAARSAAA